MNGTEAVINWHEQWIGLGFNLVATLIGVIIGFGTVYWWDKQKQKDEETKTRVRILDSLQSEIEGIQKNLGTHNDQKKPMRWDDEKQTFVGEYFTVSLASYQNALYSGTLVLFSKEVQEKLSLLQHSIDHHNLFMKEIISFHKAYFNDKSIQYRHATRLIQELDTTSKEVERDINNVAPLLKKERDSLCLKD